jgi:hypothetical protein
MESGKDLSYWPGFVDALANVVLTLVFVLVVFVFVLVMASNKVGQKVLELAELAKEREAQRVLSQTETLDLRSELREALSHLQPAGGPGGDECLGPLGDGGGNLQRSQATGLLSQPDRAQLPD